MTTLEPAPVDGAPTAPLFADAESGYAVIRQFLEAENHAEVRRLGELFVARYPDHGMAHKLLGLAYIVVGEVESGLQTLARANQLLPGNCEINDHMGCALNWLRRFPEAAESFERALAIDATRAETWVNVGKNRRDMGDLEGAAAAYLRAAELKDELESAHNNLGVVLCELGRPEQALEHVLKSLALRPDEPWAHVNHGNVLKQLKRLPEAIAAFDRALQMQPDMHEAWNNLADALQVSGDTVQAVAAAERALVLDPHDPAVLNTLGSLYGVQKRWQEAEAVLRRGLTLEPENPAIWLNLGHAVPELREKLDCYARALALKPNLEAAQSFTVFFSNYAAEPGAEDLLREARRYGEMLARRISARRVWDNDRTPNRTLRVGLVSADFCNHPVAYFLEGTLMAAKDPSISWHAYSNNEKDDEVTARLRGLFSSWCQARELTDAALIDRIVADRIDLLIDLSGHTAGHRLPVFAAKPAPVQATWLGYVGSTGLPAIDYIILDGHVAPEGLPTHTVETPWRLPESYMSFTRPPFTLDVEPPPIVANGYPTFGCFNNLWKVNDRVLDTWARILAADPEARLILRAKQLGDEGARQRVLARFAAAGVAAERIEMSGSLGSREEGMRDYARVDVALDPFPYTGMTTSVEALWMGVPVLTLRGDRLIARVGESFNHNLGLREWIAADLDDYVARARRLSREVDELKRLRRTLRERGAASPLGNPVWFANQLRSALRAMWRAYCERAA